MKKNKIILSMLLISVLAFTSCTKDLDTVPLDEDVITAANVYKDANSYRQVLAKLYAGFSVTGQDGPAGNGDIVGFDEGFSGYTRMLYMLQEVTTDEAVNGWGDEGISDLNYMSWTSSTAWIRFFYSRLYYQFAFANEFIREASDKKLDDRNITGADKSIVQIYRAEARMLRALSYWHAMDMFGNIPFVTEEDIIGAYLPEQISRSDLFDYLESELIDLETKLVEPMQNEYGRADKAVAWMVLAKMYLNAEVYTGTARYDECITYCKKIIDAGFSLHPSYPELFMADNYQCSGIIFPIICDGQTTQSYAGSTFLIHAAIGGDMVMQDYGINQSPWGGNRATKGLVNLFADPTGATDRRAMFFTSNQNLEINDISLFNDGYAVTKWTNKTSSGGNGSDGYYTDTDIPLFRLADVYLMYAEAVLRGGSGGDASTALGYVNDLRERAYGDNSGNITAGQLTLDFVLDERGRELYWECHRRTDLIRFGKYTGSTYLWPWKGGVADGVGTNDRYNIFPIPADDIAANPNLKQNADY